LVQEEKCQEQNICDKRQGSDDDDDDDDDDNNNNNNKGLIVEVERMWNVKSKVVATIKCHSWNILRIVRKVLTQHAGRARLQGTATLGTAHVFRSVLT